jgi:alpha-mannosidase
MQFFTKEKIAKLLWELKPTIQREIHDIRSFRFIEADPPGAHEPSFDDAQWQEFEVGGFWGGYDVIAWFRTTVEIPDHLRNEKLAFRFLVGPRDGGDSTAETLLYVNSEPLQAIDVWHEEAWLPPEHARDGKVNLALRAWSGVLGVPDRRRFKVAQLLRIDPNAEAFFFLADTLHKAVLELDENDWRYHKILEPLDRAFRMIDFSKPRSEAYYASLADAYTFLSAEVEALRGLEQGKPTVIGVGHSHIDLAWLWRQVHTRDKAARTFSTVLHLMRQYPEYRFMHSSPQLYRWLEQDHPDIFARVRERIVSGEWEITGGMWVEPDTNLPSGESLVRQLLHGKRYMRETFGIETNVLWLPDVFGYSWMLPQILRKSGIRYFITTKISWSQFNRFPFDTFRWRGIDGTEILTHFITTPERSSGRYTYNGELTPWDIKGIWDAYQQKPINDELLLAYGWGDGGGGPTREMLETARVMKDLPGFPKVELGHVEPCLARLEQRLEGRDVPVWDGELYLEYHRGTYTSQAQVKRDNRRSEVLLHDAEWLGSLATILTGTDVYPDLSEGWELILYNQFHDILPGSSIHPVYEDTEKDYRRIETIGEGAIRQVQEALTAGLGRETEGLVAFNSLSWARGGLAEVPWTDVLEGKAVATDDRETLLQQTVETPSGKSVLVEVPEVPTLGYRVLTLAGSSSSTGSTLRVTPEGLESDHYLIDLDDRGRITSLYDKTFEREVLAPGARGNVFQAFQDKPLAFDAWDIDPFYQEVMHEVTDLQEAAVEEEGPLRGVLRLVWRFRDSTITQRLTVYRNSRRIDFRTEVDWLEQQVLLKVAFPVQIRATRATYDIGWGAIERPTHWNTSWDWARFEVVGHKWADLSEGNYGVALLNDCKYGHDIKDHVMRLTLIKSAVRPDPHADKGRHAFTYSLLPHAGDWRDGNVAREAYALNLPLRVEPLPPGEATLPDRYSLAHLDVDHVVLETVKRAESGDAWIVRLYEAKGYRNPRVTLTFGQPVRKVSLCNLIEEEEGDLPFDGHQVTVALTPFEVKTVKIWF